MYTFFFDFFWYSFYKAYKNAKESGAEFSAACTLALFQSFNIISLLMLLELVNNKSYFTKTTGLITFGLLVAINYVRYIISNKFNMQQIKARWDTKTEKAQKDIKFYQLLYAIISVVIVLFLVFYLASQNEPEL